VSVRAAASDAEQAVELAELALHGAERVSGEAAWRSRLDGSRLLDLQASLLRAQRKLAAALERLDQALALHPAGAGEAES
jgi:hypothetical protein